MPTNATRCTFAELLDALGAPLRPICEALRETISEVHGSFVEVVWRRQRIASYGIGPKKMSEHYAYIAPYRSHVNLGFYRGAFLNDPEGLLEGKGKRLRHLEISDAGSANSAALKHLIRQAISERLAACAL
jgi:hypothetical protein